MNCPSCREPLPPAGVVCPACGADVAWHIRKPDGTEYGPFDLATVDLCIREARLGPGDVVKIGAQGEYESAQHLLGDRFPKAPPPVTYVATAYAQPVAGPRDPDAGKKACGIVAFIFVLIVGGLTAVSIPAYRRAHTMSSQAACQSNLKQIDLALLMYCQDYDERFPTEGHWDAKLNPYLKNTALWTCPAYPKEQGYRENGSLAARELKYVTQPAMTLSWWDAGAALPSLSRLPSTTSARHNGGDSFGFVDGHVKWFPKSTSPGTLTIQQP